MMGHKICFYEEIWIIIPTLSLLLLLIWSTAKDSRELAKDTQMLSDLIDKVLCFR